GDIEAWRTAHPRIKDAAARNPRWSTHGGHMVVRTSDGHVVGEINPAEFARKQLSWHPLGDTDTDPAEQWENGLKSIVRSICGEMDEAALHVAQAVMRKKAPDYDGAYDANLFTGCYGEICATVKDFFYAGVGERDAWRQPRVSLDGNVGEHDGSDDEDVTAAGVDNVVD